MLQLESSTRTRDQPVWSSLSSHRDPPLRAELEHKNEARVKLELELKKKLDELIPYNQYLLKIGLFTPLGGP